jgi:phosphoribosylformylglycinamidine synthase subunit PurS
VTVYPRREVLDPQGKAIHQALSRLGFEAVVDVRVGKSFDVELETESPDQARAELEAMCRKLLANEIMEDYEIELVESAAVGGAAR